VITCDHGWSARMASLRRYWLVDQVLMMAYISAPRYPCAHALFNLPGILSLLYTHVAQHGRQVWEVEKRVCLHLLHHNSPLQRYRTQANTSLEHSTRSLHLYLCSFPPTFLRDNSSPRQTSILHIISPVTLGIHRVDLCTNSECENPYRYQPVPSNYLPPACYIITNILYLLRLPILQCNH
jgi:hypothetical protein